MSAAKKLTGVEIKSADKGTVEAVFSTFGVKDLDGDVTLPGAFEDGSPVRISAYNHGSSMGLALPVGKGVIRTSDEAAVLDGQFFLNTQHGRDTFETVKQLGDLQEWSYHYDVVDSEDGDHDGAKARILKKLTVHEVSPVLLGAGIGTRTLAVKQRKQLDSEIEEAIQDAAEQQFGASCYLVDHDPDDGFAIIAVGDMMEGEPTLMQVSYTRTADGEATLGSDAQQVEAQTVYTPGKTRQPSNGIRGVGIPVIYSQTASGATTNGIIGSAYVPVTRKTFSDEADHARASMEAFVNRAKSLADIRAKEGRVLSAANRDRLSQLMTSLADVRTELETLLAESDPQKHANALLNELVRFEQLRAAAL